MQKGFVHLLIPIVILVLGVGTVAAYVLTNNTKNPAKNTSNELTPSVTQDLPEATGSEKKINTNSPSPSVKPTKAPATATPKPANTSTPKPTSAPTGTCKVQSYADQSNSLAVKLVYSLSSNGAYMAAAQWDFDGNGSWDTDLSQQNGTITHVYGSQGTYNVKLQLKLSDGTFTPVCSASISVPQGFSVSFSGKVFSDKNCNKVWDPDEPFLAGVPVDIVDTADYSTYTTPTSDSGGNFSFSKVLNPGQNFTFVPEAKLIPNYSKVYYAPNQTLNSSRTSSSGTLLSLVPNENVPDCH